MFQSLHSAARRMAGTISAISEDDSSESDCDSKTQQQNPSVAVTPASTSTAQAEKVSEFQAMKKSLSSLPRVQLLGMLFRTSESIRHLHEILCEEFHRQTSLEDENKLLKDHIDQLGQLMTRTAQSKALARKMDEQPLLNVPEMTAKVEQVSEAAANFAIPLVKTAYEKIVSQVTTSLDNNGFGRDGNHPNRKPLVLIEKINGKYRDWEEHGEEESIGTPRSEGSTDCFVNTEGKLIQSPSESLYTRQMSVPPNSVFKLADDDESEPPQHSTSASTETLPYDGATLDDAERSSDSTAQVYGMPEAGKLSAEMKGEPPRIAVILKVVVILDISPHSVIATDSISYAVNKFSRQHQLSTKTKLALIDYLEAAEEAAKTFPASVEVALSSL